MQYRVLASDYDDTLASGGVVSSETVHALQRLRAEGGHLVLVTGRILPDILRLFPQYRLCEWIVAENGALLFHPATGTETLLADRTPEEFIRRIETKLGPIYQGHVMIATGREHEEMVFETAMELGLELQVIRNKGAAMFLPLGVDKASGLAAVARRLELPLDRMVGIGDAENDEALLAACGYAVAVANALPVVKDWADWTTCGDHGEGVAEVIEHMLMGRMPQSARVVFPV